MDFSWCGGAGFWVFGRSSMGVLGLEHTMGEFNDLKLYLESSLLVKADDSLASALLIL